MGQLYDSLLVANYCRIESRCFVKYEKDFLTKVICELRYDPILGLKSENLAEIERQCKELLPRSRIRENIEISGTLSGDAELSTEVPKRYQEWIFHNDDNGASLLVSRTLLRYQQQKYAGKEGFFQDFSLIWQAFRDVYGVTALTRVGLRYVNQIRPGAGDPLHWEGLLQQSVIDSAISVSGDLSSSLSKSMHELRFTFDNHRLTMRFGLLNEDFPNPVADRAFLLDFDCYSGGLTEANELVNNLEIFHSTIGKQFERYIDKGLRELMEIVDDKR